MLSFQVNIHLKSDEVVLGNMSVCHQSAESHVEIVPSYSKKTPGYAIL